MIERKGDLWATDVPGWVPGVDAPPWLVIPTNGERKANGWDAVMGAGVAKKAADTFPGLTRKLGEKLRNDGNVTRLLGLHMLPYTGPGPAPSSHLRQLVAFPTKNRWREMSSEDLIERSAAGLAKLVEGERFAAPRIVLLPRVGTGLGGLGWAVVKKILERHLEGDRYVVVTP